MTPRAGPPGGLTHKAVGGMLWMGLAKAGRALLQLVVLSVLARLLAPADFGVVSAALVVIGFSAIFSQLGLGPAVVQRPVLERRHLETAFLASVLFGVVIAAALWLAAPAIAAFYRIPAVGPVLRALVWVFPLRGIATVSESLMQRDLRFRWLANREVATYAIGYGLVGIVLARLGWGVWALVAANMVQALLNTALLVVARPPVLGWRPDRDAFRDLVYFSGGITAGRTAMYLAHQGDNLVVGRWLGPAALGIYGRAYQLMAMPAALFGDILDSVLFPAMAQVQQQSHRLATAYRRSIALVALVMLPTGALFCVLAPEVVHVVLGPGWASVTVPFQIFSAGLLFRTSYKVSDSIARATGAVYRRAWRQGIYAALVLLGAWAGRPWGVEGVALGVLGAVTVNFLFMAHLSASLAEMRWRTFLGAHLPALSLAAAAVALSWPLVTLLRQAALSPPVRLGLVLGAALGGMALLVRRWPRAFVGSDGLWMLKQLRGRFRPTRRGGEASGETDDDENSGAGETGARAACAGAADGVAGRGR